MQHLYSQCFNDKNIELAIKTIFAKYNQYATNYTNIPRNIIIKEVKLRLRRYKRILSKIISKIDLFHDPSCEKQLYIIYHFYDLIAQQCVYQVLLPVITQYISKNISGYQHNIDKRAVLKAIHILQTNQLNYIIHINFKSLLQNISIDKCLMCLKYFNIHEYNLIKTIKHLIWQSKTYNGIGIDTNNFLAKLLITAFLYQVDQYIANNTSTNSASYRRNFRLHKDNFIEWCKLLNKKIYANYYRHNTEAIIICHSKVEQLEMQKLINQFFKQLNIQPNITLSTNQFKFCHFYAKKKRLEKMYLEIRIDKYRNLYRYIRSIKFNSLQETWQFKQWIMYIMSYYDIVNDMSDLLNYIIDRMYYRSQHISNLQKIDRYTEYVFISKNCKIIFDLFDIRAATKISYKEYNFNKVWIKVKDYINPWEQLKFSNWIIYKQALFVKQQGKDPLSREPLKYSELNIHHKISRQNGGEDRINNLLLINQQTHMDIHNSNKYVKKLNHL